MKKTMIFPVFFVAMSFFAGFAFPQGTPIGTVQTFDGKNLFHYKFRDVTHKPYVDVLCTPDGRNILRDSPSDHIHHHGLMFAINVNDVNFWEENVENAGKQEIKSYSYQFSFEYDKEQAYHNNANYSGDMSILWNNADGEQQIHELRTIDVKVQVVPNIDTMATLLTWKSRFDSLPAILSGNHYHGLGMRFHESMDKGGRFFSSAGSEAEPIRGDEKLTKCKWMAYTANLEGKPVTVAIFDASNENKPVTIATSGLGAPEVRYETYHNTDAKPMLAFTMGDAGQSFAYLAATANLYREPIQMDRYQNVEFCYGVAIWEGERTPEEVEETYQYWIDGVARQNLRSGSWNGDNGY